MIPIIGLKTMEIKNNHCKPNLNVFPLVSEMYRDSPYQRITIKIKINSDMFS